MQKKIICLFGVVAFLVIGGVLLRGRVINKETYDLTTANIEALTSGEYGGNDYALCYYESVVKKGYTYYDCGGCKKVYDEKGRGTYSKCFY